MFSLLRNDIENPSYKRGLALPGAMLIFYGLAFQIQSVESLKPDILKYGKWVCLVVAIFASFRAMAERRILREQNSNYVSMIDASVISLKWQAAAIGAGMINLLAVFLLLSQYRDIHLIDVIPAAFPLVLFILGTAYLRAAKRWVDDPH